MMITRSKKNKTTFTTNPQTSSSFDGLPLDLSRFYLIFSPWFLFFSTSFPNRFQTIHS
ncbi:BnaC09g42160D [Brassica napus]|uniref:BnaC09g42160D protein n=1 Tax=Brassica napus TaxID=3708 RepID=A0A078GML6_BRANA|nr:BnaC09g42160D [Brassica napus]